MAEVAALRIRSASLGPGGSGLEVSATLGLGQRALRMGSICRRSAKPPFAPANSSLHSCTTREGAGGERELWSQLGAWELRRCGPAVQSSLPDPSPNGVSTSHKGGSGGQPQTWPFPPTPLGLSMNCPLTLS